MAIIKLFGKPFWYGTSPDDISVEPMHVLARWENAMRLPRFVVRVLGAISFFLDASGQRYHKMLLEDARRVLDDPPQHRPPTA